MKAFEKIRGSWIKLATRISYAFAILTIVLPARAFAAAAAGGLKPTSCLHRGLAHYGSCCSCGVPRVRPLWMTARRHRRRRRSPARSPIIWR